MLSPLQERVARIVGGLVEAEGFALAGGAALIVRGDVDRQTRDLDFFGPSAECLTIGVALDGHRSVRLRSGVWVTSCRFC